MLLDKFTGHNVRISPSASIGNNVRIGNNAVIYDNVVIGDETIICNDCVLGEPLNDYYHNYNYENPKTIIGSNSLIRSNSIVYAGSTFGKGLQTGHNVTIRENTTMGINCSVGTLSDIQGHSEFGDYVRLHSNVHIGQHSKIGNFCWIYPYTVFTNDPTPPSEICIGPTLGDYSIVATHCLLLPGVTIGRNCLIGACTMVSKDVPDNQVMIGYPGKIIKEVKDIIDRSTGKAHYPWPFRYSKNMPWDELGYEKWAKNQLSTVEDIIAKNTGGGKSLTLNTLSSSIKSRRAA